MKNELCNQLPAEVKTQLCILDKSKFYIYLIIFAILISLNNLNVQKEQVVCSALRGEECVCPSLLPDKLTSNLIILAALLFFYNLTANAVETTGGKNCSANLNYWASCLTLGAVIIRIIDLLNQKLISTE